MQNPPASEDLVPHTLDPQSAIWKNTDGWKKNSADIRISRIIA